MTYKDKLAQVAIEAANLVAIGQSGCCWAIDLAAIRVLGLTRESLEAKDDINALFRDVFDKHAIYGYWWGEPGDGPPIVATQKTTARVIALSLLSILIQENNHGRQ